MSGKCARSEGKVCKKLVLAYLALFFLLFQVLIHSPQDVPQSALYTVMGSKMSYVNVNVRVTTMSTVPELKKYSPDV